MKIEYILFIIGAVLVLFATQTQKNIASIVPSGTGSPAIEPFSTGSTYVGFNQATANLTPFADQAVFGGPYTV